MPPKRRPQFGLDSHFAESAQDVGAEGAVMADGLRGQVAQDPAGLGRHSFTPPSSARM